MEEINNNLAELGKSSKMLEVDAFWVSRLLLEVTHDMLVDVARDVLEEKTIHELKTCEGLSDSSVLASTQCPPQLDQLEPEWNPDKKGLSLRSKPSCSSSVKKVSMMELIIDKEVLDEVSSHDNSNCLSHSVLKEVVYLQSGRIRTYEESLRKRKRKIENH